MLKPVNRNPSPADVRKFGVTILIGLAVIGGVIWWLTSRHADSFAWRAAAGQKAAAAMWILGAVVCITSFASQAAGKVVYVVWMTMAYYIGRVTVPFGLTVIFVIVLAPFSLIRLKDPLRFKLHRDKSYWEPHKPVEATLERMQRPF